MTAMWSMRTFRDSLVNLMSGLGVPGRDKAASGSASFVYSPLTQMEVEAAYRSNWLARKLIDIPAQDAVRAWRAWQCDANETEVLEDIEQSLNIQNTLKNALIMARLYGGAALVLGVDQGKPYEPLDLERVGKGDLKFVVACSRYTLGNGPIMRDVMDPNYGKPEYFTRAGNDIMSKPVEDFRIHPSRVIMLRGMSLPDTITTGEVWGDSVLQVVLDAVVAATTVAQSIATLVSEAKVDVIHIPDLTQNLSTQEYANQLTARFAYANVAKSVVNTLLLDKEEEWERIQANFTTLPDILQMYLIIVSGAADIPATRMLGQSPSGLNATGDADLRNYYDHVSSDQQSILSPVLAPLDDVLIRTALGDRDPSIYYVWNPLWQLSETEQATVNKTKADAFAVDANTGIIDQEALRIGRQNQLIEDGVYPGFEQALEEQQQLDLESMVSVEEQQAQAEAQMQAEMEAKQIGGAAGGGGPGLQSKKKKPNSKKPAKDSPWTPAGFFLAGEGDEYRDDGNPYHRGYGEGGGQFTTGPGQGGSAPRHEPAARARARGLHRRGELSRGSERVATPRRSDLTTPLQGLPTKVKIPGHPDAVIGPHAPARAAALAYTKAAGIDYHPPTTYARVNPERATRIAQAYDEMKHDPQDPTVKAAYAAMISETIEQWHSIEKTGLDIDWIDFDKDGDPYAATPRLATEDVRKNNHLWVFPTHSGFGSDETFDPSANPLLADTGIVIKGHKLTANDVFRIVHDYYGHIKEGNGFRADGEENAWRSHSAMYSPMARWAMTSETRGQNSWVNYGPYGESNRTAASGQTHFADQKVGLLPEWVVHEGSGQPDDPTLDDEDEPDHEEQARPATQEEFREQLKKAGKIVEERHARVNSIERKARGIVAELGYDANKLHVVPGTEEFIVDGKLWEAAGMAYESTGEIKLFADQVNEEDMQLRGLVSHEVEHQRFNAVLRAYDEQTKEVMELLKYDVASKEPTVMKAGKLLPPYDQQFPLFEAYNRFLDPDNRDKLIAQDGVSEYSEAYWKDYLNQKVDSTTAIHETLAEIARFDAQGIATRITAIKDRPMWVKLYDWVNQTYDELNKQHVAHPLAKAIREEKKAHKKLMERLAKVTRNDPWTPEVPDEEYERHALASRENLRKGNRDL